MVSRFAIKNNENKCEHFLCFRSVWGCFRVGFTSSVKFLYSMLFILIVNNALMRLFGSAGVAVFNVVQNASFMLYNMHDGAVKAMQPLVSTYRGECNKEGQHRTLNRALIFGSIASWLVALAITAFAPAVCHVFEDITAR